MGERGKAMAREELVLSWAKYVGMDLAILSGDIVNPVDPKAAWQDVAGTLACNLQCLANELNRARRGESTEFFVVSLYDEFLRGMGVSE